MTNITYVLCDFLFQLLMYDTYTDKHNDFDSNITSFSGHIPVSL